MTRTASSLPCQPCQPLRRALMVLAALVGTLLVWVPAADSSPLELGYRDQSYGTTVTAPTGQKPQSKLWYAAGSWWGVLWSIGEKKFTIHKFNPATEATDAWTSTGVVVDVRRNSQADVLWDGAQSKLYVVTHLKDGDTSTADRGIKFLRFGYAEGSYSSELSKTVVTGSVEAAVLDKDSTGQLWITYTEANADGGKTVKVAHSTKSDGDWTKAFSLPVGPAADTSADDISTVIAYGDAGGRKIGVLWSNERTSALYFASHPDGAADDAWTLTTLCSSTLCPDDHLNIKSIDSDASGNLYAVVKTSLNDKRVPVPDDPLIVAYRLNPSGSWSSAVAWTVGDNVTRAIVVLDSENREAHLFAAGPCCAGGTVYTKTSGFDDLSFPAGLGTPFMRSDRLTEGEAINNVTSTKQTVNRSTGLLVLASIDRTREYVHRFLPLGAAQSASPSPTPVSPTPTPTPTASVAAQNLGELARASASTTGKALTLTTTSAVPAGARVVVGFGYSGAAGITASAADDAGSAWSVLVRKENGTAVGTTTAVLTATIGAAGLPAGTRITLTVSTNVTYRIALAHAFSGVSRVATTSDGTGSTANPAAAPVTAAAGDVLYSVAMWNSGTVTHQPGSGVVELAELAAGSKTIAVKQVNVADEGSVTDAGQLSSAVVWTDAAALLRP